MSHFSFYPYFLSPPYPQYQFQQNLHSLYFLPYSPNCLYTHSPLLSQTHNRSLFPDQFQHLTPNFTFNGVQIKNQELSGIPCNSTNINIFGETPKLKKQQINEKNQGSSLSEEESSDLPLRNQKPKGPKKLKTKKLSKREKQERQMKRNSSQNSKRNIIPNEIHQILSIILKKNRSTHLVGKLLTKFSANKSQISLSVQRFYLYQSLLKEKINHYANEQSLRYLLKNLEPQCAIYSLDEQEIYCKVGLTLISYFLRGQASLIILNSQRIKTCNKLDHLKMKRYLQNFINEMIQETFHQKKIASSTIEPEGSF